MTMSTGERIRATDWKDYIGQEKVKERLVVHIGAARKEGRMLDHMLLVGPPGAGKTNLALLVAAAVGDDFVDFMMPIDMKQLVSFIQRWEGGVLLLDEIHRAPDKFQESLLSIEQGYIQLPSGQRISTRHVTFILATTERNKVVKPLLGRMLIQPVWEDYSDDEMAQIISGMAVRAEVDLPADVAQGLTRATGGTPRTAGQLIVAARDLAASGLAVTVEAILDLTGINADGLTPQHQEYVAALQSLGGQAGLANLASILQHAPAVVMDLERLLIKRGYLALESTGRRLTPLGQKTLPAAEPMDVEERRRRRAA